MNQSLASVLLPEYRRRVLGLLLLHPEEALHGREIARRTGLSAGTVTRELLLLNKAGLLKRIKRGNQQAYSADTACPIFPEMVGILRKTSGMADVLAQALEGLAPNLQLAFVFGSMAQGRESAGSDIDLMLVGDLSFGQAVQALYDAQISLGREINPKVFTAEQFASMRTQGEFAQDVLAKPKIYLIGDDHELEKLGGHIA